jgi:DNA-binding transcriptional LysR family regulator
MAMELRHIRYFLAVAEEGSVTRGAERVGIGQPPLSLQIKDLETEVGCPLFRRVPQGVVLTAAGSAFYEHVRGIPDQVTGATLAAQRAARGELGSLRIGFTASSAFNPVVTDSIQRFRRAYANVELTMEESNTTHLVEALHNNALDAAFIHPGSQDIEGLQLRLLSEEPFLAVLPANHAMAGKADLRLKDLAAEPFVLFPRTIGPALFDAVLMAGREAGFELKLGQVAPQFASIINLVAAEAGVSLVPASLKQLQVTGVVFRDLADVSSTMVRLSLAWRRGDSSIFLRNFLTSALA